MKTIRTIYLYLFTIIGLSLLVSGSVQFVDMGLKAWVFTQADVRYEYPIYPEGEQPKIDYVTSDRHRDASNALAMIAVGLPLYLYHWGVIKKEA